ncbi:MAG: hypothetical protein COB85_06585 [Bacteroidetes bacterium]|nr:MAG: hypothetical protein COB85_06585 [Bacteroidota bacterium]
MYNTLFKHIRDTCPSYTEEHFNTLMKRIQVKEVTKKEVFFKEGNECNYGGYVFKGCLRYYKTNSDGEDLVTQFAFEDHWVGDVNSLVNGGPSKMSLQALENCTIMALHKKDFKYLVEECPGFSKFQRTKRDRAYDAALERTVDVNESAEERYKKLLKRYPQISQRIQLYHMASYLGLTPESLSRIRKNLY